MEYETLRIRKKALPKIQAILRTRGFYETAGIIQQFKSHVRCLLEQSAFAIYHAAQSHFESLSALQRSFVRELDLYEAEAFLVHKLAPLALRRNIAALGLLHKIQLGEAHPDFSCVFQQRWMLLRMQRAMVREDTGVSSEKSRAIAIISTSLCSA